MSIIRAPRPEGNFYLLSKSISEDRRLSWGARGMLVFLLGKPDHWKVSPAHLRGETAASAKPTGRDGIYGLLDELINAGYVRREQSRSEAGVLGEVNYLVSETPLPDLPYPAEPHTARPHTANPTLVSIEGKQGLNEAVKTEKSAGEPNLMEAFEQFWKLYPNKASKKDARKAWERLKPNAELQQTMLTALAQHRLSRDWLKDDGQYIPHGARWINGEKWNDVLKTAGTSSISAYHGLPSHTQDLYPEVKNGANF
ncbi:hypothetical protein HT737_00065 [Pseudomonas sp. MD195_PC81_125]|uniref:hypothetical protein n=1 Tax=Pseudomonas sp. MD195_PC81_125 TaxID=2741560 RepID=UPI0015F7DA2D|nr:hypothetical protein [Pseudomonas sp. MD195_PC81_125]MBA5978738.1 hypothetical protein [Pseudomonas sp. MD195_PC81_125]